MDQDTKTGGVKIDIGKTGKNCLTGETIDSVIYHSDLTPCVSQQAKALDCMSKKIFKAGYRLSLTTDTDGGAGDSFSGLFTLIAVHGLLLGWGE